MPAIAAFSITTIVAVALLSLAVVAFVGRTDAGILAIVGMPIPLIVAIVVERLVVAPEQRLPLRQVLALTGRAGRVWRGIATAIAAFIAVAIFQILVANALGISEWALPSEPTALALAVATQFVIMGIGSVGEELGWRGWLHTRIRPYGLTLTMLFTSALWVAFHVPFLAMTALMTGWQWAITLGGIAFSSFLLTALRERFDSVWPAVVGHASMNSVLFGVQIGFSNHAADGPAALGYFVIIWAAFVMAAALVVRGVNRRTVTATAR